MQQSKLYIILSRFDKYEQNRIRKYIKSPYFNQSQAITAFFELLITDINSKSKKSLTKEHYWKAAFPKEKYNDLRFRKLGSDLLQLIEGFLSQEVFEEDKVQQITNLLDAISKKKIEKLYNSSVKKAATIADQQLFQNSDHYYDQYILEKCYYDIEQLEKNFSEKGNIEKIIENLDRFYLAEKIRLHTSVASRLLLVSHEYKFLLIDEILLHLQKYNYDHVPPIAIYYQIYLTQTETDNEAHYHRLKELIHQFGMKFPRSEASVIYLSALNYCVGKINQGNPVFLREYLNLYQELLQNELIFDEGKISPWNFNNVVLIALRLQEYQWTESFIRDYQDRLPADSKENLVSYNLSRLYFYQKKYDKVLRLLSSIEYEDYLYNLSSKAMLSVVYYEQDEIEALLSLLESFRTYLNRHKDIPERRRKFYLNYIKHLKSITTILPGEKEKIQRIKNEMNKTFEKQETSENMYKWLLEKLEDLS